MAYRFMQANKKRYAIKKTAELLGVGRSAYYKRVKEGVSSRRQQADAQLVRLIRQIVTKHHRRCGNKRICGYRPDPGNGWCITKYDET